MYVCPCLPLTLRPCSFQPHPTDWDGRVSGPAIYHFQQIGQGFWEPLLIAIGVAESYRVAVGWATPTGTGFNSLKDDYEPGDLGFDPLGLKPTDPEELKVMQVRGARVRMWKRWAADKGRGSPGPGHTSQLYHSTPSLPSPVCLTLPSLPFLSLSPQTKELNNGRLAMIAIAAFVAQELVEQTEIFEHLALRFEKEAILELDDIERDLGLPVTPLPDNLKSL